MLKTRWTYIKDKPTISLPPSLALREKYPYSELFWSVFSRIRTEYGKIRTRITPNTDTFYAVLVLRRGKAFFVKN